MIREPWLLGSLLVLFALQFVTAWYAYRSGDRGAAVRDAEAGDDPDGETIECPGCGTENERRYRFCRSCVRELPGAPRHTRSGGLPGLRGVR